MVLSSVAALGSGQQQQQIDPTAWQPLQQPPSSSRIRSSSSPAPQQQHAAPDAHALQSALDEIASLKSQLSGIETAVTVISRASNSAGGRHSPSHGRRAQQQQQQHVQAAAGSTAARAAKSPGALSEVCLSTHQLPAAPGKLSDPKPGSPHARPPAAVRCSGSSQHPLAAPLHPAAWLGSITPAAGPAAGATGTGTDELAQGTHGSKRSVLAGSSDITTCSMTEPEMQAVITVRRAVLSSAAYCSVMIGAQHVEARHSSWLPPRHCQAAMC